MPLMISSYIWSWRLIPTYKPYRQAYRPSLLNAPRVSKNRTPAIFQYFTETDRLSMTFCIHLPTDFGRSVRYGSSTVENHLRGFHRNCSTIAGYRAVWARTFNSGILASEKKLVLFHHRNYGRLTAATVIRLISLQDLRLHAGARVQEANSWRSELTSNRPLPKGR